MLDRVTSKLKIVLVIKSLLRSSSAISDLFYSQTASLKLGKINFSVCTFAMMPVALFYSLFGTESPCLPVGREDRNAQLWNARQFLLLLPTGKIVDNQKKQ
jgi:hypothetical protein